MSLAASVNVVIDVKNMTDKAGATNGSWGLKWHVGTGDYADDASNVSYATGKLTWAAGTGSDEPLHSAGMVEAEITYAVTGQPVVHARVRFIVYYADASTIELFLPSSGLVALIYSPTHTIEDDIAEIRAALDTKLDKPAEDGSEGDVLELDSDGDPVWVTLTPTT